MSVLPLIEENGELIVVDNPGRKYSASEAINHALPLVNGHYTVFVHSDIVLPSDFLNCILSAVVNLKTSHIGVIGVAGMDWFGTPVGMSFQSYQGFRKDKLFGSPSKKPVLAQILDEQVLIIPSYLLKSKVLVFDQNYRGFHLYGADLCIQAIQHNLYCYAITSEVIHIMYESGAHAKHLINKDDYFHHLCYFRNKWAKINYPIFSTIGIIRGKETLGESNLIHLIRTNPIYKPHDRIVFNSLAKQTVYSTMQRVFEQNEL